MFLNIGSKESNMGKKRHGRQEGELADTETGTGSTYKDEDNTALKGRRT